eukprot:CAMPEP_0197628022 /NCGR_PEP_ID=MMETSP1338-20131121/6463_1 /TAXON_ID=43686 ORGANISM="Pelagodinium beii, Strain RCC1491" /NCGR_SAMPLE_ID=MMETSP1338 /ASSEMBLY_ACC=CAM_ASM_000754 /LENGTH=245 /DNA_ID=CAMNT_0043198899 /DNA_START=19 /DNA_END=754 /DNA_ORIENTATION=-
MATALFMYCHASHQGRQSSDKVFLGLIVIQMLPLVFLEFKVVSCPDPVGMLSLFGSKVLLLHGCFMLLRILAWPLMEVGIGWSNLAGFVAIGFVLNAGFRFRWTFSSLTEHVDVCALVLLASVAAFATVLMDEITTSRALLEDTIHTASSYIEVLGFIPAVWMVYQSAKKSDDVTSSGGVDLKRQAMYFSCFLVGFYIFEDLITASKIYHLTGLAACGHVVHFLLLAHFASFLIFQTSQGITLFE